MIQDQINAFEQAKKGIIPNEQYQFDPELRDKDGNTVCYYLWDNGVIVPEQWQDQQYKNPSKTEKIEDFTEAMQQVDYEKKIPDKKYYHDPNIEDYWGDTVAMHLAFNGIIPSKQWYHKPDLVDKDDNTVAMFLAKYGINIPQQWKHDPLLTDVEGKTIAMHYAKYGHIPPQEWEHDPDIYQSNKYGSFDSYHSYYVSPYTVADFLGQNNLPVPNAWYDYSMKNTPKQPEFVQQALYGEIPNKSKDIDPEYDCGYGWTIAMLLAMNKKQIPKDWEHDPNLQNNNGDTVAMLLANNGIIPPQEWQHNKYLRNYHGKTVQMILQEKHIQVPEYWQYPSQYDYYGTPAIQQAEEGIIPNKENYHEPWISNEWGETVAYLLIKNDIQVPDEWKYDSSKLICGETTAMKLAQHGIIPPKQWIHDPNIKCVKIYTVAYYLKYNKLPVPNEWYNDNMKDKERNPEFVQQAIYGTIPNKPDNVNPEYQNCDGWTVAMILARLGKDIPKEWQHKPNLQNEYGDTVAMILTTYGKDIPQQWIHEPELQNNDDNTVALLLAQDGIVPQKQWYHNPTIVNNYDKTVEDYLLENKKEVPEHWRIQEDYNNPKRYDYNNVTKAMIMAEQGRIPYQKYQHKPELQEKNKNTVAMLLASKGIISPQEWKHDSSIQNNYGNTVAMILAENRQIPVKKWYHDSQLQNNNKDTVAMLLAQNGIIPPKEWYHNPNIKNNYGWTVAHCLKLNNLPVPNEWYDDKEMKNKEKNPDFIQQAIYGIIPLKLDNIQSNHCNCEGWTVAMILAILNKQIPLEWQHDKYLRNNNGDTVQSILHKNNIEIPKYWQYPSTFDFSDNSSAMIQAMEGEIPDEKNYHDPRQTNIYGDTVAMILASKGLIPSKEWMHDITMKNKYGNSIESNLLRNNYIYQDEKFIYNVQVYNKQSICCICLEDGEQEFIKTKCGHNICLGCFKELIKQKEQNNCPECRRYDWFIPIDNSQYQQYLKQANKYYYW